MTVFCLLIKVCYTFSLRKVNCRICTHWNKALHCKVCHISLDKAWWIRRQIHIPKSHPKVCFLGCPEEATHCFPTEFKEELDVPAPYTRHSICCWPALRYYSYLPSQGWRVSRLCISKRRHASENQATSAHLHTVLFPTAQGKEIHQNYPTPTPSGRPETSPLF